MQIDAMYDSGTVILPSIRLKHSRFQVQVIIPDDEIIDATSDRPDAKQATGTVPTAAPRSWLKFKRFLARGGKSCRTCHR
jgi:hypothetical protein